MHQLKPTNEVPLVSPNKPLLHGETDERQPANAVRDQGGEVEYGRYRANQTVPASA
jgi:hypothetical protein